MEGLYKSTPCHYKQALWTSIKDAHIKYCGDMKNHNKSIRSFTTITYLIPSRRGMVEVECSHILPLLQSKPESREPTSRKTSGKCKCAGEIDQYVLLIVEIFFHACVCNYNH